MRQAEAALAIDQAAIEAAQLNLGYTEIRAPFAGRLGRNQAANGALVGPATGPLNTLVQLDPIYVTFNPSETELARDREGARRRQGRGGDFAARRSRARSRKGELTFLDNVGRQARPARSSRA